MADELNEATEGSESDTNALLCGGGECCEDGHDGEVKAVNVIDEKSGHDWGEFNYCDNAIKEDIRRGLTVTIKDT